MARTIRAVGQRPPRALRAANLVAGCVRRVRPSFGRLDVDDLCERATVAAGLDDFGSDEFREPLSVLVGSLESDAQLTPAGRLFARGALEHALENRLHLQADWKANPEILDVRIAAPTYVIGLPRTGTTLLQNLLALDPGHRNLLGWEAATPSPPPTAATYASDPRIAAAARTTRLLDYLAPEARRLHPVGPTMPTECVTLFVNSCASLETTTINQVWGYLDWCLGADYRPHYDYYHRQLQLLQWRNDRGRWLLKSPAHLFWVDRLIETFPDARIVQTHRDPVEAVLSYCSLAAVLHRIGSDHVDHARLGAVWPAVWAEGLERSARARDTGALRVFDCHYSALVADPVATVEAISRFFDDECSPTFVSAMRDWLRAHPQHAGGVHTYEASDFGIDLATEHDRFAAYRERFDVAAERGGAR